MVNLDIAELRLKLDLEGKYVDFGALRTALSVRNIIRDLDVFLSEANKEGECRGCCPKCGKEKSFSLNVNTNRFNCFAKGCVLKGGGVIDFFAKLYEVPAKEASHLLACAYGIQPYTQRMVSASDMAKSNQEKSQSENPASDSPVKSGEVSRAEFAKLQNKVERLSMIVWSQLFESGEIDSLPELLDDHMHSEMEEHLATVKRLNESAETH